jgi:hypothetical protein
MPTRLEMLRALVAQGSTDPFVLYGLAMELRTDRQAEEACRVFESLLQAHPDYIPAYAPAADTLVSLGRSEEARMLCRQGIEHCARKGQKHAGDQLQTALDTLG